MHETCGESHPTVGLLRSTTTGALLAIQHHPNQKVHVDQAQCEQSTSVPNHSCLNGSNDDERLPADAPRDCSVTGMILEFEFWRKEIDNSFVIKHDETS